MEKIEKTLIDICRFRYDIENNPFSTEVQNFVVEAFKEKLKVFKNYREDNFSISITEINKILDDIFCCDDNYDDRFNSISNFNPTKLNFDGKGGKCKNKKKQINVSILDVEYNKLTQDKTNKTFTNKTKTFNKASIQEELINQYTKQFSDLKQKKYKLKQILNRKNNNK